MTERLSQAVQQARRGRAFWASPERLDSSFFLDILKAMKNPIKLGVIGTGSVVREIYQYLYFRSTYSPLIEVAAVCDTNDDALKEFCDQWNIPTEEQYSSYTDMIAGAQLDDLALQLFGFLAQLVALIFEQGVSFGIVAAEGLEIELELGDK